MGSPPASVRFDAGIAVAVFVASVAMLAVGADARGRDDVDALTILLSGLASLPLVLRRRAPLATFVLTGLASTALHGIAEPEGPPLGPTLALYWMVAGMDESAAVTRRHAAVAAGVLVAHLTAAGIAAGRFPVTETVFGVLVWSGAWLAGERTRLRQERMAQLEERALRAERDAERERQLAAAEERTRIARDLHDSAGHAINVILVHAGLGRLRVEDDPAAARQAFATIEEVARETVGEIDEMVRALREQRAAQDGEVEPPAGIAALDGLVERHRAAGLDVSARVRGETRPLPAGVDRAAFRIVQEALTNAVRHGEGSAQVDVAFGDGGVDVTVVNPVDRAKIAGSGHGIVGMRERAALVGGSLDVDSGDGRFRVHAHLPAGARA